MNRTLIIGKNSFLVSKFKELNNSNLISHKYLSKVNYHNYKKIILLSMPQNYKKKLSKLSFEKNLFKNCKHKRIIYFSTSLVYPNILQNKEDAIKPQNIYAQNKSRIENEIKNNFKDYLIIRAPVVFTKKKFSKGSFFDILTRNFKLKKIKFNISENSIRDLITLNDLYLYYKKMDKINLSGVYNIGSNKGFLIKDIILNFFGKKLNNKKIKYEFSKKVSNLTLNVNKLEHKIGKFSDKIYRNVIRELNK
jgi:dTDP-4-dehydrorhamnose reductase